MTVLTALAIATVAGIGVWLLLDRDVMRIVLGTALISHAAVLLMVAPRPSGRPPLVVEGATTPVADPVPQALSLTAIVIAFAVTALLLALAGRVRAGQDPRADDDRDDGPTDAQVPTPDDDASPERHPVGARR